MGKSSFPLRKDNHPNCIMLKLLLFAAFVCLSTQQEWEKPEFCMGLDCPRFIVLEDTEEYQLRACEEATVVSAEMITDDIDRDAPSLAVRLLAYFLGSNDRDEKLPETNPLLTINVPITEELFGLKQALYLPYNVQSNPPLPNDSSVKIERSAAVMYVRGFSGLPSREDYAREYLILRAAVGEKCDSSPFIGATYARLDNPEMVWNEVGCLAAEEK